MVGRPSGTVTFLFTDIEGSTALWETQPDAMRDALVRHDTILAGAVADHGGYVFSTGGDGLAAAFERAGDALSAATDGQLGLAAEPWPEPADIRVRMGLHTGEALERDGDYFGPALNRAARIMAAGHGGQVLCSAVTAALVSGSLPDGAALVDLGPHRLRDLSEPERLFQLVHPGLPDDFPLLRTLDTLPGNLPHQVTAFIGREEELREVAKGLEVARVVTLCGVGGVGKTRLALQVAAETLPRYGHGAWMVELAPVSGADSVDEVIASALGVQSRPGIRVRQGVVDFLRDKTLLLLLDNCEHLLTAVAQFVDTAVREAPGLRVLATSREGLAVAGERLVSVPSLGLPDVGAHPEGVLESDAVRLFVDRAMESSSGFVAGSDEAASMAELCRRLDGIPLAIELAAARVAVMTPQEITVHLDQRFKLLTRGRRTAETRQQTLRNTIDWSYELLSDEERRVLRRLAVFAGDFGLAAAEAIAAGDGMKGFDVLDLLARLVEKSLVVAEGVSGETRYRLLETMRHYARERLEEAGEVDPVSEGHARYFLDFAKKAEAGLGSPQETVWRERVERELENLRAGLRWFITSDDTDSALAEIYALADVGSLSFMPFGMLVIEAAEMPAAAAHPLRAAALGCACMSLAQQGALDEMGAYLDETERLLADVGTAPERVKFRCRVRACLTTPVAYQQEQEHFISLARDGLADARAIGDRFEEMRALILLAAILGDDERDEAIRAGEEALALARELEVPSYLAWAPMWLATRLARSDPAGAEDLLDEARSAAVRIDNAWAMAMASQTLAGVQAAQGRFRQACRTLLGNVERAHQMGDDGTAHSNLALLSCTLAALGEEDRALLAGSWVGAHGHDPLRGDRSRPMFGDFGCPAYVDLVARRGPAALEEAERRVGAMTLGELLEVACGFLAPVAGKTR
ncbi:MAG TPA: adenylate/guanylate cyclase domain-containing protein [Acidimicrobiales bacterium]|nr:adenylate/guanylate cyclase domain-containing protein [Acidimicrobiales bacterium]